MPVWSGTGLHGTSRRKQLNIYETHTKRKQMNPVSVFKEFHRHLRSTFPDAGFSPHPAWEEEITAFEEAYFPHILPILQRTEEFFNESRMVFGVDVTPLWSADDTDRDEIWKHFQMCLFASFLSGDIKGKLGKVLDTVKGLWAGQGHSTDEIDKILNDEETQGKISEILEFLMNTRLAGLAKQLLEQIDISSLGINLESPEQVMEILRDQNHPVMKSIMTRIQTIMEEKMRSGEFSREMLIHEIELIKNRLRDAFGDVVNEYLGLGTRENTTPAAVLLSTHPDARRARMLARLQRKYKEREGKTSR